MKKQLLLTRMLLLVALLVGSVSSVWATDQTITLTQSSLGVTGSSYSSGTKTIDKITFAYTDFMKNNSNIQAKASTGEIHNTTAFPTNIKSVAITHSGTARSTTISGSSNGTEWTQVKTGSGSITGDFTNKGYKYFKITRGSNAAYWTQIVITYEEAAAPGTTEAPTITGNTPFLENTTVTITNAASANGADIFYTLNGDNPTTTTSATCFAYSDPFEISSTTTVKAIAKKSTDTNASSVVSKTFTKVTPMTVTAALTAIDALADNATIADQCVTGIVSTAGTLNNGAITYSVSVDGTTTNELQVYKGKGLNGDNFENASDIAVGDVVVIYGTLKNYNGTTPEFDQGSYLLSKVRKPAPTFLLDITEKTLAAYGHESVDVTLTTNTDGEITCESDDEDVATVALKSGKVYTITAQSEGTATITIRSAASANYAPASATVAITVQDNREEAGISFDEDAVETTWGDPFTGQDLTNTNSVAVTWSSTDETVATVTAGVVTILKAGETDIKATFDGNATYKAAVASYTLTVNKANAGLSYTTTSFDIMLNDDSFVAPTLNNPNSLTGITYSSNNETVAIVDENTGELAYESSAVGTAKITATFAGNDWYKSGSANYTINIVDPTVKGSKYNPYTVAEVIDGTATGNGIYVSGFIVGEYVNNSNPRTSGFLGNSNLALAGTFTTSPVAASCIPVELPSTATTIRANWGLMNKPSKYGYEVLIKANATTYFGVNGIKGTSEITAVSVPATISAAGYATFSSTEKLDFTGVEGLTAYKATATGESSVTLKDVTGVVPAETGLLLKGAANTYYIPVSTAAASDVTGNLLQSTATAEYTVTGDETGTAYVFGSLNDVVGFYKAADGKKIGVGKSWLLVPGTGGAKDVEFLSFVFGDEEQGETDGIKAVSTSVENDVRYNLAGQKVGADYKGIVIVNGKKFVVK